MLLVAASGAPAASWRWGVAPSGRERLQITLDTPDTGLTVARTAEQTLSITLTKPGRFPEQPAPERTKLFTGATQQGTNIEISLGSPDFGYIALRPSPVQVIIDVYPEAPGKSRHPPDTPAGAEAQQRTTSSVPAPVKASAATETQAAQPAAAAGLRGLFFPDAHAASPATAPSAQERNVRVNQGIRATINKAGPEAWPESKALSSGPAGPPPAAAGQAAPGPTTPASRSPAASRSATAIPVTQPVTSQGASVSAPMAPPPQASEPAAASPATRSPAAQTPATSSPAASSAPTAPPPRTPEPAASTPTARSPAAQTPATSSPAASGAAAPPARTPDPAASTPTARSPAAQTPATSSPAASGAAAPPAAGQTPAPPPAKAVSRPPLPEEVPSSPQLPPQEQQTPQRSGPQGRQTAKQPADAQQQSPADRQPPPPDDNSTRITGQTKAPQQPAPSAAKSANATVPVIYVDEKGNPVPKPPDPAELMAQAMASMQQKDYRTAFETLNALKAMPLPREQKEQVLHRLSDVTWEIYKDRPREGYDPIVAATNEAINANLRSPHVPAAMLRLGEINLLVGNLREAEAYILARRSAYPPASDVPVSFLRLGLALLKDRQYAKAAGVFREIIQQYPDSPVLERASAALATALAAMQEVQEAGIVIDFVERRWPRHYIDNTAFLLLQAEYSLRRNKLQDALQQYWLYYNLEPDNPENDKVLLQIGEIYLRQGRIPPAIEVFEEILRRYPDGESADYALLRLAEKGIHDGPAITREEMFAVFNNPGVPAPQVAYAQLKKKNEHNATGILSSLKLVLWQLWDQQHVDAIRMATDYIDMHPEEPGASLARQVLIDAFEHEEKMALQEENYGRIMKLWNAFPLFRARHTPLSDTLRVALVKAHLERGDNDAAIELLRYFLQGTKHPEYGEYAFTFFFNKYLAAGDWSSILDLGEQVAAWEFLPLMRNELDYAMALSAENLGLPRKALPLWQKLAPKNDIPLYEKAYATYFLAKDAEQRKDIKAAYEYNKAVLDLFSKLEDERSDKADPDRIKEAVASLMDISEVANRIPEALDWLERYNSFAPEGSPEYPGVRFRESRLYRKMGDTAKSRALLEQIIRTDPDSPFGRAAASELRTFDVSRDLGKFAPKQ
jgi:TolA-binding protein